MPDRARRPRIVLALVALVLAGAVAVAVAVAVQRARQPDEEWVQCNMSGDHCFDQDGERAPESEGAP